MDSMEEIYMKHGKMIYGFLLTRTRDPGLAEELTQETFYQAVKHIGGYKGESSISTWLCAIAKNLWRDYLRRQKDHVPLDEAEQVSVESAESRAFCLWDNVQILKLVQIAVIVVFIHPYQLIAVLRKAFRKLVIIDQRLREP